MKVTAILKGLIDSNGHQPIQIRVAMPGNKRTFVPTKIKVPPKLFEKGRVKKEHPSAKEYNAKIERLIIQAQADAINGVDRKAPDVDFYAFLDKTIPHLTRAWGTMRQYQTQINKLKVFKPQIRFSDFDHDWFDEYRAHLTSLGNDENTQWNSFKFLKKFFKIAIGRKIIKDSPLKGYNNLPRYVNPKINYLTEAEVRKIEKFIHSKGCTPDLFEVGVWFLIGCYTGLRISDIKAFTKEKNIVNNRLILTTKKTGELVAIPILPRLKGFFQLVKYVPLSIHANTYNILLKVLAKSAGINKRLHANLSRHTAAMLLAEAGVSQEVVAKILGHTTLSHTSVYYKITNERIAGELKKVK